MIGRFWRTLARHATNYQGWRTDRKIVVIESDDWGSACMPSAVTFRKPVGKGIRVDVGFEKYAKFHVPDSAPFKIRWTVAGVL